MSAHPALGALSRRRRCVLRGGTATATRCNGSSRACGQKPYRPSGSAAVAPASAVPAQQDGRRKAPASVFSAATSPTSSAATNAGAVPVKGSPYGSHSSPVAAADVLLSLNHTQRLLRRLPVGASHFLFHYNELPSNIREKMPLVVRQQQQRSAPADSKEEGHANDTTASAAASAPESEVLVPVAAESVGHAQARRPGGTDFSRLLSLSQPQLTASEKALFALFRGAQKERQLKRLQRLTTEGRRQPSSAAPPPFTDPLLHLRLWEEPCLLIPDTRGTFVSLGLAADSRPTNSAPSSPAPARAPVASATTAEALSPSPPSPGRGLAANALATSDTSILDDLHLGLTCTSTDYRTDYASLPVHYVLGVPTVLLEVLRSGASSADHTFQRRKSRAEMWEKRFQAPVDISRWLVFDIATSQVLLRRRSEPRSDAPSVSTLEAQVFLAHTYTFDPWCAYEAAALQARVPAHPPRSTAGSSSSLGTTALPSTGTASPPLYSLFFFTVARGRTAPNSRVSPIDAGVLYPSCFFSYMTEVPTSQQLATETAAARPPCLHPAAGFTPSALVASDMGADTADSSSFFVSITGKRLRACAHASSLKAAHLWTAQLPSRRLGGVALDAAAHSSPSLAQQAAIVAGHRVEAHSAAPWHEGEKDAWRQASVRRRMSESFRTWCEAVAARLPSPSPHTPTGAPASAGERCGAQAPGRMTDVPQRPPASEFHVERPRQMEKPHNSMPSPPTSHGQGQGDGRRWQLEEQLDAESVALKSEGGALAQEWSSSFRFGRVAIAVAMPLLFPTPQVAADAAAAPRPALAGHQGRRMSGADAATDATVRVADAPLADALWSALYTPAAATGWPPTAPFGIPSPFFSSNTTAAAAATTVVPSVLPVAEDRLMLARERVLLPFLLHQPRWVLPSSGPPVPDIGAHKRSARERGSPLSVNVCPSLWRLDELERLCGWRDHRLPFKEAFGSFCGLLIRDLYILLGRQTPAMLPGAISAATWTAGQPEGHYTPLSPVVLFNDVAYVERVLLPAMRCFAAHSCTWVKSGLCVYRSPHEVLPAEACHEVEGNFISGTSGTLSMPCAAPQRQNSRASREDEPANSPAEAAVEVTLHHRQLSLWLQQLQRTQHKLLRRWLAVCHGRTRLDPELNVQVKRKTGGVPAASLLFFAGSCSGAPSPSSKSSLAPCGGGGDDDLGDCTAVGASATAVESAIERLLSLTPDRIAVVPLLDFVVWGALCSDFSAASLQHLAHAADGCRATLDASADGLAAVKYCVRYPRHLCCAGGRGATVALLR
ncbi:hypothetical protein LSCM1_06145 [Leishmania martiniquensis]|uniref:Uncharacterized protein n=1 Tax=Leishmania martiniquensis TaxID=1580590 RepID=A0A836GP57_9TRYP|nr:hypothetical protein LSCM1_06145 [Leishmania martiniquensis]